MFLDQLYGKAVVLQRHVVGNGVIGVKDVSTVLLGGCDKTTPGLLMGAVSMGLPTIFCPAGPMLRGHWGGKALGSGSDAWKYWDEKRAGKISEAQWSEIENGIARSFGTCMTMGTAATMMGIAEAMGMTLPGASSMLAADSTTPCRTTDGRVQPTGPSYPK